MTRFEQRWRRSVRCGYGYAEGVLLHGKPPERRFVREVRSIMEYKQTGMTGLQPDQSTSSCEENEGRT